MSENKWNSCKHHPHVNGDRMWGCPECLYELRKENERKDAVIEAVRSAISNPHWLSIGSINNVAEVRIPKETYNKILATLGTGAATHDAVKEAARAVNEYFKRIRNDNNLHADLYDLLNEMSAAIEGEKR